VEPTRISQIALPRVGVYVRMADGVEHDVVPASVHFFRAGEESRVSHPVGGGDGTTALTPSLPVLEELTTPDGRLPCGSRPVDGSVLVLHTRLISALRRARTSILVESAGGDATDTARGDATGSSGQLGAFLIEQLATELAASAVAVPTTSTEITRRHQRRLASEAVQLLASESSSTWSLTELAARVGSAPCALSRSVSASTGRTLGSWWSAMRLWRALCLLAADGSTLAGVAAATGYADQAHLTRAMRRSTGSTPATLRKIIQDT
jgi:AraC-like DNA-binding protein